ncbi:hypothetical protein Tco_0324141 [Tanacetum coccineum]
MRKGKRERIRCHERGGGYLIIERCDRGLRYLGSSGIGGITGSGAEHKLLEETDSGNARAENLSSSGEMLKGCDMARWMGIRWLLHVHTRGGSRS